MQEATCQCEVYQTCSVCHEETERDLARLRKRESARVAHDVIPLLSMPSMAVSTPLPEYMERLQRAILES